MGEAELHERIKELEHTVETLEKDLIHDHLTGLKTRAFFEEEARVYFDVVTNLEHNERKQWFGFKNVSFLFIDVDFFKKINDTYGHNMGDEVLKSVSKAICESVREGDTCARWGGEEIAVILVGATERDAKKKAEDICHVIASLHFKSMPGFQVTVSIGVASAEAEVTFEETLKRADKALYKAKEAGRNRVVTYSEIGK